MQFSVIHRQLVACSCLLVCAVIPGRGQTPSPSPLVTIEAVREKAAKGDAAAQFLVGRAYATGRGLPFDEKKAVEWYTKAAEQNFADSQIALGQIYFFGSSTLTKDYAKAAHWFAAAADQGRPVAQNALGALYEDGLGVEVDVNKAAELYLKSAEQGDAKGQSNIGRFYTLGQGNLKANLPEAYKWLTLSADQGEVTATEWMFEYRNLFTAEDKKAGIKLAHQFRAHKGSPTPLTAEAAVSSMPTAAPH